MGKIGYFFLGFVVLLYLFGVIRCIFYAVNAKKNLYTILIFCFIILSIISFTIIKLFDSKETSIIVEGAVYLFLACNIIIFVMGYICERTYKKSIGKRID